LLRDAAGNRLAKRDRALAISSLREAGRAPADIIDEIARLTARSAPP